jgi:hypothetical protein
MPVSSFGIPEKLHWAATEAGPAHAPSSRLCVHTPRHVRCCWSSYTWKPAPVSLMESRNQARARGRCDLEEAVQGENTAHLAVLTAYTAIG